MPETKLVVQPSMNDKENKELTRSRKSPSSSTQLVPRHKLPTCKSTSSSTILRMTENRDKSASNNRVASAMTIATDMMPKVAANTLTKCCLKMQRHTYSTPTTTTTHKLDSSRNCGSGSKSKTKEQKQAMMEKTFLQPICSVYLKHKVQLGLDLSHNELVF